MRVNRTLVLVCLLFSTAAAAAPSPLSWDEAVQQTRLNNPQLKKAEHSLRQAELAYRQSMSGFFPQLSANAGMSRNGSDNAPLNNNASYGLAGSLSLFSGFKDLSAMRSSDCDRKIAAALYQRAYADVLFELRTNYITLLWAQEAVKLAEDILKRRTENAQMIELRYDSGAEDKGGLLRVQADRQLTAYQLAQAQRKLYTAQRQLARTMGRDDLEEIAAAGNLDPGALSAEPFSKGLVAALPEYRVAAYTTDKAAIAVTTARGALYPDLTLTGSIGKIGTEWMPETGQWSGGLHLTYPFFAGGKNINAARIVLVNKSMAEETLQQTARELEMKLRRSHDALMDAFESVAVKNLQARAAAEQERITTTKYMNGLSSYQDWYVITNDYVSGQTSLLNAQRDAALALAQWENDLGSGELK